jgi:hypothetical protein
MGKIMAAEKQVNLNASLYKYLNDQLSGAGVKIFEHIYLQSTSGLTKWVVIDVLAGNLGAQPSSLIMLHMAVANKDSLAGEELDGLQDLVIPMFEEGQRIDVYDRVTKLKTSELEVCKPSLSPILEHAGGGLKRSLTIEINYVGN